MSRPFDRIPRFLFSCFIGAALAAVIDSSRPCLEAPIRILGISRALRLRLAWLPGPASAAAPAYYLHRQPLDLGSLAASSVVVRHYKLSRDAPAPPA